MVLKHSLYMLFSITAAHTCCDSLSLFDARDVIISPLRFPLIKIYQESRPSSSLHPHSTPCSSYWLEPISPLEELINYKWRSEERAIHDSVQFEKSTGRRAYRIVTWLIIPIQSHSMLNTDWHLDEDIVVITELWSKVFDIPCIGQLFQSAWDFVDFVRIFQSYFTFKGSHLTSCSGRHSNVSGKKDSLGITSTRAPISVDEPAPETKDLMQCEI